MPDNHLGEAQAMALGARFEFVNDVLLLDELAARAVAEEMGLTLSGFAGVFLVAVQERLLTADELKERLETCRRQGTHYSEAFIGRFTWRRKEAYDNERAEKRTRTGSTVAQCSGCHSGC